MIELHAWLEEQLAGKEDLAELGLGRAITYLLRHVAAADSALAAGWGLTGQQHR
jgi:hypothetical protein